LRWVVADVLGLLAAAGASAGERKPIVTVQPAEEVVLASGRSIEARFTVVVADGFHLQANPASEKYLIPTKLELGGSPGVELGSPVYPAGRPFRLQGASSDLSIYEGLFVIRATATASRGAQPGLRTLAGALRYQACDARRCLPPTAVLVEWHVRVAPPTAATH